MKLLVLTNKDSLYGKKILNYFYNNNIKIHSIVVVEQNVKYHFKLLKYVYKRVGLFDTLYFILQRLYFDMLIVKNDKRVFFGLACKD